MEVVAPACYHRLKTSSCRGKPTKTASVLRRTNHNVSKSNRPILAALQVDWTRQSFLAIQRAPGDSRYFAIVNYGDSVLQNGQATPEVVTSNVCQTPGTRSCSGFGARNP